MHQELDAHGLARVRRHVHRGIDPGLSIFTLVKDGLQDLAAGIRDVRILPIEGDGVGGVVPVPEAQNGVGRHRSELLVERALPVWLGPANPARQHRKSPAVRVVCRDYRRVAEIEDHPGPQTTTLDSISLDNPPITNTCNAMVRTPESTDSNNTLNDKHTHQD